MYQVWYILAHPIVTLELGGSKHSNATFSVLLKMMRDAQNLPITMSISGGGNKTGINLQARAFTM
jgi:hypothetical protein